VKKLDVTSPQGEVAFAGGVRQRGIYTGGGHGSFRWKVGERSFAGTLDTRSANADATLLLKLSAPLDLQLQVEVTQKKTWPWRFTLEAPRFDPREELLPTSSFTSLAASLSGHGSTGEGAISGKLVLNDEPLMIEPLRFIRNGDDIAIDTVLRISHGNSGAIHLGGDVDLGREPVTAKDQRDVARHRRASGMGRAGVVHARQARRARQRARVHGTRRACTRTAESRCRYRARSARHAAARGARAVRHFAGGRTPAARGRIDLQPKLAWDVSATARDFDPGAFAAAWRGKLGFDLASQGQMQEQGPQAKLQLTQLRGELRGRPLSGNADVSLAPPLIASGTAELKSGKSTLQFRGRNGDRLDANVSLNVASLNDWVPDSGGELQAAFVVRGKWPDLSIEGNAHGLDLHAAGVSIDSFHAQAEVADRATRRARFASILRSSRRRASSSKPYVPKRKARRSRITSHCV
jgi:translocation and assembly module TamB